jgi:hypothetical protein
VADEERLIEEARRSRDETQRLREGAADERAESDASPRAADDSPPDEPWAKTSRGDADDVTDESA